MKNIWKRFEEWATGLRTNLFTWARIKLTVLYLLIIILILTVYSAAMYFSLLHNIQYQVEDLTNAVLQRTMFDTAVDNLQLQIFLIDSVTLLISALASYWLAGITLKPIKRALEAQEAFSADASHELRTPLAVMKTDIEVLLRGKESLSTDVTNVLKSSLEEITILSEMTSDLLELSRGRYKGNEKIALAPLIIEEVEKLQTLAQSKDIVLSVEHPQNAIIEGNREAVARVFKNCIANAIAYTNKNGAVTVSLQPIGRTSSITITDNGIGIAPQDLPHIFERFYKADNARTVASGSGLGLAIAKQIVEQYQGTIAIDSIVNQGTTVTIIFPSVSSS